MLPLAFRLDRRAVLLLGCLIGDGRRCFDRQLTELFFAAGVLQIVAPQAGLRFEANMIPEKIL